MIISLLKDWQDIKHQYRAMLCSVVEWKGSVPRKDYPMMLVLDDGQIRGTIGGGSMELKISQIAREMMSHTTSAIFDFDMTGDDVEADVGLCGGTLKVLVEPFSAQLETFYVDMLQEATKDQKLMVKLTVQLESPVLVHRDIVKGQRSINHDDPSVEKKLRGIFENQLTRSLVQGDELHLMWQAFTPPTIHIFGAGHVGQAVAFLAHYNEVPVNVYDDRTELLTSQRFPYAKTVITDFPINREAMVDILQRDFVLIASREHRHDRELLFHALKIDPRYIGLVSSSRKWKLLAESLHTEGVPRETLNKVHAPVGIDIDAQTVPEIAMSIMSEMIAFYRGKVK